MSPASEPAPADEGSGEGVPARFQVDLTGKTLLGVYRVERRLAEGGMGSVWLAHDTSLSRPVVVKVPHTRFLGEPGFRARFRREVSELVRLEHPHVVRIHARGEVDDVPFFVLQYLGGGSLEDRLAGGPQDLAAARAWLEPVATTLDFLHGQGVVHRDVKPGNILFDPQGHVFLSDFGVVKALGGDESGDLTAAGTGVGSPFYMAPEQGLGRSVAPASDQYALASTLYEALVGEPPFGRGSAVQILLRREREAAPSVGTRLPGLPAACVEALDRALLKDPEARFPSCQAFAQAFLNGAAAAATPAPPGPSARDLRRRLVAGLALLVAALGAVVVWLLLRPHPPPPEPPSVGAIRPGEPLLVLGSPGAEPRRALRFRLRPDSVTRAVLTTTQTFSGLGGADATAKVRSVREHPLEVSVGSGPGEGPWPLSLAFPPARSVALEGGPEGGRDLEQRMFDRLGALQGQATLDDRGRLVASPLKAQGDAGALAQGTGEALLEQLLTLAVLLPEEPLGVGAEWDVTSVTRIGGVRLQQTRTWRVLSLEGSRVRLRFQVTQSAPMQDIDLALAGEPVAKTTLTELQVAGSGEMLLDLERPLVVSYEGRGSLRVSAQPQGGDPAAPRRFESAFEARLEPR